MRFSRNRKKYLIAASGATAILLIGGLTGVAVASIPDSSGVIHACYQSPPPAHGANLQVIDTGAGGSCGGGMAPLTWNQTGPQGPAGANGVSGYQQVSHTVDLGILTANPPDNQEIEVFCPAGKVPLGGGFDGYATDPNGQVHREMIVVPEASIPLADGWKFIYWIQSIGQNYDYTVVVYATCASVS